jgi:membrane fusion protein, multidrug efflux system
MAAKWVYWVAAAAGISAASGAAWWWQSQPSGSVAGTAVPAAGPARPGGPAGQAGPGGPGGPGAVPSVEAVQVQTARLVDDAQAVGTLRSRQSVTLRPEVSGRIVQIAFTEGAPVRRGQLLVQLDDTLQRAELSQAEAQLSIARANLRRNEELVAQNFVAQRVLDESRAALQVAEAQVQLAQARLSRMRLTAPFNATAGIRQINLGDFVRDGADLVNLEDLSVLQVDFRLPERYQSRLSVGQPVAVQLDALPGLRFAATVQAIDPLVDADGRALLVRAALPTVGVEGGASLRPGMFARVNVVFEVNEQALVVPEEAIVPQGDKHVVYRLEKEGEGDSARTVSRRTEVQLGIRRGANVQVVQGLSATDTVVVAGQQRLQRDGTPVRVIDVARRGGS